jgi:hypothetical protein
VSFEGELAEWEDVRLQMLDKNGAPIPRKVYGKVIQVQPGTDTRAAATIRFTSVAPEIYQLIREWLSQAAPQT